MNPQIPLRFIS